MDKRDLKQVFKILHQHRKQTGPASVTEISRNHKNDPYRVLISCLISLRTKDEVTEVASKRLFELATTPQEMVTLSPLVIQKTIFPCGFYRNKARTILAVSQEILDRFEGRVPETIDELLTLKGVGRKTANLVITLGYKKPGICVDTHVHRITNRWGIVDTQAPDQTETQLRQYLPTKYWISINDLLVNYGRTVCKPVSPLCSECALTSFCQRIGVEKSR